LRANAVHAVGARSARGKRAALGRASAAAVHVALVAVHGPVGAGRPLAHSVGADAALAVHRSGASTIGKALAARTPTIEVALVLVLDQVGTAGLHAGSAGAHRARTRRRLGAGQSGSAARARTGRIATVHVAFALILLHVAARRCGAAPRGAVARLAVGVGGADAVLGARATSRSAAVDVALAGIDSPVGASHVLAQAVDAG
jgi:hypothetical protein